MRKALILISAIVLATGIVLAQNVGLEEALNQIETKLKTSDYSAAELSALKTALRQTLKNAKSIDVDAIVDSAKLCKSYGLGVAEAAKVSAAANRASEESTAQTRAQTNALVKECLKDGCDAEGLEAALEAVKSAIAQGYSPKESRGIIAATVLEGLKDGLRGKELAAKIHEVQMAFEKREQMKPAGVPQEKGVQGTQMRERRQQQIKTGDVKPPVDVPMGDPGRIGR